ncbi:BadF/BadG/BcrA/BcrD ATPase family protein [Rugosimonospora africana]|uniref:ATPase BadF/BadG/BcrA/BcrD type domain-containing protein n=1 Tax=Rugosimonospora africana TaxID=556532 RepID=A0A8J3QW69_9ACTN|nr:BadF/BadG/BcrA/BcrD ATPase family protein [Rugosimonospora africana]GIH17167.1 hypothetical protein Raf01_53390 [Rugosimonospora africana]
MPTYLLVDAGQTGTRMRLAASEGPHAEVDADLAADGLPAGVDPQAHLTRVVTGALQQRREVVDGVAVGLTGLHGAHGHPRDLLNQWSAFGPRHVVLADDSVTGYLAAVGLEPAVVVSVGTGVVALATSGRGGLARVDGWGHLLGDHGGGYWIGRAGLEYTLRTLDGRSTTPTALPDAVAEVFGDPSALPATLQRHPDRVRLIADFARQVLALTERQDPVAERICLDAAQHLAVAAAAAASRADCDSRRVTVSWSGSLLGASPVLADTFGRALRERDPRYVLRPPAGSSLDGVRQLIDLAPDHPLAALTSRAGAATEARS